MNTRRDFIKNSIASSALISLSGAAPSFWLSASAAAESARTERENILVVVQLSGGNDGLNTVIPFADEEYYKNRFTLAIAEQNVLKLNDHVGLNPALRSLTEQFEAGGAAVIQGVGYPSPNRSHFEAMDLWHTAHAQPARVREGWLGKTADAIVAAEPGLQLPAIHFGGETQPLALANADHPLPSIRSIDGFRLNAFRDKLLKRKLGKIAQLKRSGDNPLLGFLHESSNVALATSERLDSIRGGKNAQPYPGTALGEKLSSVARLIEADLPTRIYYVTLDGFDTHSNQRDAHNSLLQQLSEAVAAFTKDLEQQGNGQRVATVVFSEFGRRVRENASRGTDHGTAAPMFLFSDRVTANLVGDHPSLTDLDQGDLKFRIDYRTVYASLLKQWLGVEPGKIVGPAFQPISLFKA